MKAYPIFIVLLSLAVSLVLGACASSPVPVEKILYIASQMVDCPGDATRQCLQVKEDPGDEYTPTFESIEGFEFVPGYEYVLRVVEERATGASGSQLRFVEVVSKTLVSSPLKDSKWILTSFTNAAGELEDVMSGTQVTLEFTDGKLSGNAGCNSYFGDYRADTHNLAVGSIASTEMFCTNPEGVMEQESEYLRRLLSAVSYTIDGENLTIANADGEAVLIFSVLQPVTLSGEVWEMVAISSGQGEMMPALAGASVTAVFSPGWDALRISRMQPIRLRL
jgi:heat shock protein HslJ